METDKAQDAKVEQMQYVSRKQLRLHPNLRKEIDKTELDELRKSIIENGILQPILCRLITKITDDAEFEVIAGQRRHLATEGMTIDIPIIVQDIPDSEVTTIQLLENIQRVNLSTMDEARAFKFYADKKTPLEMIAKKLGKTVSYVAKRITLNNLLPEFQAYLQQKKLQVGLSIHLAALSEPSQKKILKEWNVKRDDDNSQMAELISKFRYLIDLAPFDVERTDLSKLGKDCGNCPFNSKNMAGLFPEEHGTHICQNAICYEDKVKNNTKEMLKEALTEPSIILITDSYESDKDLKELEEKFGLPVYNNYKIDRIQFENEYPQREQYDSQVKFDKALAAYKKEEFGYFDDVVAGKLLRGLVITGTSEGSMRFVKMKKVQKNESKKTEQPKLKDVDTPTPELIGQEIERIKTVEKRKTELDFAKVTDKLREQVEVNINAVATQTLTRAERAALIVTMVSLMGYQHQATLKKCGYNFKGKASEEIAYASKISDKSYSALCRLFIFINCKQYANTETSVQAFFIRELALGTGVDVKAIEKEYNEGVEARKERVQEKMAKLKSQSKELLAKKPTKKKRK